MADERIEFLYGPGIDPDDFDLDDVDVRSKLLERSFKARISEIQLAGREIIAAQILGDEPPEAWATVQRLQGLGVDRDSIFSQMALAFSPVIMAALDREERPDPDAYREALAALPLPDGPAVADALTEVVRTSPGISADEAERATVESLGYPAGNAAVRALVDRTMDELVDRHGLLAYAAGDHLVHAVDLTSGIVLTHVVTASTRLAAAEEVLLPAFDLAAFGRHDRPRPDPDEDDFASAVLDGGFGWLGPDGWLDDYPEGTVLAVRVDPDGEVDIDVLDAAPACDDDLVALLRAGYDRTVEEPWLPVEADDLVLAVLLEDPHAFDEPVAPLSELAAAAGLERRGTSVAHDESVWHNDVRLRRTWRVFEHTRDDGDAASKVLHVLDVADLTAGVDPDAIPGVDGPVNTAMLREVLADLRDEQVLLEVIEELYESVDAGGRLRARAFVEGLLAAASKGGEVARARLVAAIGSEKDCELDVAEQHLELAHEADPNLGLVIDRLAWYASDRGDAAKAARLWRQLEPSPAFARDLAEIEAFARPAHSDLGRNQPCWCGSGRKFKQCHLGSVEAAPLPDRVGWLCRKAAAFVERYGWEARTDVVDVALTRAVDPEDDSAIGTALEDPIVLDLVLTEGGWFERFTEERGSLLPDDEALLAASWMLVDRSVYEVLEVRPGSGLDLRDLRSGDVLSVRERTFSRSVSPGVMICARAVPDGETNQLIGGLFPVRPGNEEHLLDVLDGGDPLEIASWVSQLHRPPTLQTREGESLVECELVIDVGDAVAARAFLDATYEDDDTADAGADADAWREMFALNEDEEILRARLGLDGTRLTVSTTSEERAERILSAVRAALAGAVVVSDERTPMDVASILRRKELEESLFPAAHADAEPAWADGPEAAEALSEIRDRFELRWCDESVPALDGLTPREAAADPTTRERLVRLIASFENPLMQTAVTMRPERLRELLGL